MFRSDTAPKFYTNLAPAGLWLDLDLADFIQIFGDLSRTILCLTRARVHPIAAPTEGKPGRGTHPSTAGETPTATRGLSVDAPVH